MLFVGRIPHEEQRKGILLQPCIYSTTHIIIKSSVTFGPRIYGMASFKTNIKQGLFHSGYIVFGFSEDWFELEMETGQIYFFGAYV